VAAAVLEASQLGALVRLDVRSQPLAGPGFGHAGQVGLQDGAVHHCEAGGELSKIITRGGGHPLALVLAGDPDSLASGFSGWQADARRARRGCLTAPVTLPEGELIGTRLTHAHIGRPVRPGRALLNTGDGTLVTVTVPAG